jgi:hypothetical protein
MIPYKLMGSDTLNQGHQVFIYIEDIQESTSSTWGVTRYTHSNILLHEIDTTSYTSFNTRHMSLSGYRDQENPGILKRWLPCISRLSWWVASTRWVSFRSRDNSDLVINSLATSSAMFKARASTNLKTGCTYMFTCSGNLGQNKTTRKEPRQCKVEVEASTIKQSQNVWIHRVNTVRPTRPPEVKLYFQTFKFYISKF